MKTYKTLAAALALSVLGMGLTSCNKEDGETTAGVTNTSEAESSAEETTEDTAATTLGSADIYRVFSSADNSFSLTNDGCTTPVKSQSGASCFANAVAVAMESNYLRTTGDLIEIDADFLMDAAYGIKKDDDPTREGLHYSIVPWHDEGKWALLASIAAANGLVDGLVLTSFWELKDRPLEEIHEIIREHGAVVMGIADESFRENLHNGYVTFNTDTTTCRHMVALVGWDDGFPSDYYTYAANEDGAWYAQNSYSEYWGINGYFWISYEIPTPEISSIQVSPDYSHVETYDYGCGASVTTGDTTTTCNVYDYSGTIGAVGTFLQEENTDIHLDIYEGRFGELIYSQDASFTYSGYDTIVLDEPVEVNGEFTVALTYDSPAPVDGETREVEVGAYFLVTSEPDQSYVLIDGEWYDLTRQATSDLLGLDFIANNACIKVLFL